MDDAIAGEERVKAALRASYKKQKEAFVSNLNGGTLWEINNVTLVAPVTVLLWSVLQSRQSFFHPYTPAAAVVDFLLNCAAILYATTVLSSSSTTLNIFMLFLLLLILPALASSNKSFSRLTTQKARPPRAASSTKIDVANTEYSTDPLPVKPFVTAYRGTMMVITCVAILAVDFKVFPRRFAKTENWGTSLMDLGVGSFVFSAGVVAARPILKQRLQGRSHQGLAPRLKTAARHAFPLFILGLIRLYSVKGLDYAEHVTEYGVHWNFFFTLAFVPPFVAVFDWAFRWLPSYSLLAVLLSIVYELALDLTDLKKFILTGARTNLFSQNREGIFSFFGYLAIFLAGQGSGMYVLPRAPATTSLRQDTILRQLITWTCVWCALFYLATDYRFGLNLHVSRRLANLPYVLWTAAFNTGQLALFYAVQAINFREVEQKNKNRDGDVNGTKARADFATSRLLRSFNRNGLGVFLTANLLTGLVNLTVPTLEVSDHVAMAVLMGYLLVLAGVAFELDRRNISIKL